MTGKDTLDSVAAIYDEENAKPERMLELLNAAYATGLIIQAEWHKAKQYLASLQAVTKRR